MFMKHYAPTDVTKHWGRFERRSEVFVKFKKKIYTYIYFFFGGGGVRSRGGVRVDVNGEEKFL